MNYGDFERLLAAREKAREDLLAERAPQGHWIGELASSALATATAVSALALVQSSRFKVQGSSKLSKLEPETWNLEPFIERGCSYLTTQQNADGGFGDTDLSHSNIATTMLVRAAFHLSGAAADTRHHGLLARATGYIEANGGIGGLRARYGKDKTFAVPILTNCALAGLVGWHEVNPLPFELAAFPQSWYRFFRLPVVSYAIPALVAIGQARYFHLRPRNLIAREIRRASISRTLKVLQQMQPESGGYLEAIPLTSFVVMSLAGTGRANHLVARRGVKFLLDTARPDGSWPIDTNLATWVTTLAINALEGSGVGVQRSGFSGQVSGFAGQGSGGRQEKVDQRGLGKNTWSHGDGAQVPRTEYRVRVSEHPEPSTVYEVEDLSSSGSGTVASENPVVTSSDHRLVNWLLSCQHTERHAFTGASPGGWGWSDLSGAVPDADDTAGALLALARFADPATFERHMPHGPGLNGSWYTAAIRGMCWLTNLQNRDGGFPTFCRGWGALPFDRSSPDLTAHALRALFAWIEFRQWGASGGNRFAKSIDRGLNYLARSQRLDGSWVPLWFGNQDHPDEENPVYGTTRVLLAFRDLGRMEDQSAVRGVRWLMTNQNADGGWGTAAEGSGFRFQGSEFRGQGTGDREQNLDTPKSELPNLDAERASLKRGTGDVRPGTGSAIRQSPGPKPVLNPAAGCGSSVEETAWAVEGLLAGLDNRVLGVDNSLQTAIRQGVDWLVQAVEDGRHRQPAPIGFYFAKLWYYEKLYPLIFTVSALGEAAAKLRGALECQSVKNCENG